MNLRKNGLTATIMATLITLPLAAVDPGYWQHSTEPLLNEDVNTSSHIGQWTETFVGGNWGLGSWVKGNGTNAVGNTIWQLDGPSIVATHPSVFSDGDGDGVNDTILTNYQGGTFTLYDAPGLWGSGAVFDCVDTIIEDHFNPFTGAYEYGYVWGAATNAALGLTVNIYGRVIETSVAGLSHSGELTELTIEVVPEPVTSSSIILGTIIWRRRWY